MSQRVIVLLASESHGGRGLTTLHSEQTGLRWALDDAAIGSNHQVRLCMQPVSILRDTANNLHLECGLLSISAVLSVVQEVLEYHGTRVPW